MPDCAAPDRHCAIGRQGVAWRGGAGAGALRSEGPGRPRAGAAARTSGALRRCRYAWVRTGSVGWRCKAATARCTSGHAPSSPARAGCDSARLSAAAARVTASVRECAAPGLSCAELLRALTAHAALRQGRFNPGIQSPIPDPFNFAGSRIFFKKCGLLACLP